MPEKKGVPLQGNRLAKGTLISSTFCRCLCNCKWSQESGRPSPDGGAWNGTREKFKIQIQNNHDIAKVLHNNLDTKKITVLRGIYENQRPSTVELTPKIIIYTYIIHLYYFRDGILNIVLLGAKLVLDRR